MPTQDFIKLVTPGAQEVQRERGMFASVTIAQAIWETGSGIHTPSDIYTGAESYNLFGRKASGSDPFVTSKTWEVYNGVRVEITAKFKKFKSYEESVLDRSIFLTLPWYQKACKATNAFDAVKFLIDTGYTGYSYATDPNYVNGVSGVIRSYNLTQYDIQPVIVKIEEDEDSMAITAPDWMWQQIYNILGNAYNAKLIEWSWLQKTLDRTLTSAEYTHILAAIQAKKDKINIDAKNDAGTDPKKR